MIKKEFSLSLMKNPLTTFNHFLIINKHFSTIEYVEAKYLADLTETLARNQNHY